MCGNVSSPQCLQVEKAGAVNFQTLERRLSRLVRDTRFFGTAIIAPLPYLFRKSLLIT
jgi:hypothetical protein